MTAALGPQRVKAIQRVLDAATAAFNPNLAAVPAPLAHTPGENLPAFRRSDLLDPVAPPHRVSADAYVGDYTAHGPDLYVLPKDAYTACTLGPGRAVFLSDGVTSHYALVYRVDGDRRVVTFIDRWAPVSFLLPGHNVAGVAARAYRGPNGQPFLDLGFDDLAAVMSGSIEALATDVYFRVLEKLYPKLAGDADYLFWKTSRQLASGDFETELMVSLQAEQIGKGDAGRRFATLKAYADDEVIGVISGFTVPALGRSNTPDMVPKARTAFLGRLDGYATTLPWTLKWLLAERAAQTDDAALRLAIVDAFLKADPTDVDFAIERAAILLLLTRPGEAAAQIEAARSLWEAAVARAVTAATPAEALAFFFADDYGLISLDVLRWEYARIELLADRLDLLAGRKAEAEARLNTLLDRYKGSLLRDFFGDLVEIAWLQGKPADAAVEIRTALSIANDDGVRNHFAEGLYRHFTRNEAITDLPADLRASLGRSDVGRALCRMDEEGVILPLQKEADRAKLTAFCRKR